MGNEMAGFAFYAYPTDSPVIAEAINGAVELSKGKALELKPWKTMRGIGFRLDDLIRDEIQNADALVADITYANFNVFYEIGYAIAVGKPVIPTVNVAIEDSVQR